MTLLLLLVSIIAMLVGLVAPWPVWMWCVVILVLLGFGDPLLWQAAIAIVVFKGCIAFIRKLWKK